MNRSSFDNPLAVTIRVRSARTRVPAAAIAASERSLYVAERGRFAPSAAIPAAVSGAAPQRIALPRPSSPA